MNNDLGYIHSGRMHSDPINHDRAGRINAGLVPMRRHARSLPEDRCLELLRSAEWGVLSMSAPASLLMERAELDAELGTQAEKSPVSESLPYAVPLNYALQEHGQPALIFHAALAGLKLDVLDKQPAACFTVVPSASVCPERMTTRFESVQVYGRVRRLTGQELAHALRLFAMRFSAAFAEEIEQSLVRYEGKTVGLCLDVETINGKYNPGKG